MQIRLTTAHGSTIALHCLVPCFTKPSNCSEETFFVELEMPHQGVPVSFLFRSASFSPTVFLHSLDATSSARLRSSDVRHRKRQVFSPLPSSDSCKYAVSATRPE